MGLILVNLVEQECRSDSNKDEDQLPDKLIDSFRLCGICCFRLLFESGILLLGHGCFFPSEIFNFQLKLFVANKLKLLVINPKFTNISINNIISFLFLSHQPFNLYFSRIDFYFFNYQKCLIKGFEIKFYWIVSN